MFESSLEYMSLSLPSAFCYGDYKSGKADCDYSLIAKCLGLLNYFSSLLTNREESHSSKVDTFIVMLLHFNNDPSPSGLFWNFCFRFVGVIVEYFMSLLLLLVFFFIF